MKCVLIFTVLFAAWISGGEAATCQEVSSCLTGMSKFANMDRSKMDEACTAMRDVLTCFKSVIKDCREKHPDIVEQQMSTIQPNMDNLEQLINDNCNAASALKISLALILFALLAIFI